MPSGCFTTTSFIFNHDHVDVAHSIVTPLQVSDILLTLKPCGPILPTSDFGARMKAQENDYYMWRRWAHPTDARKDLQRTLHAYSMSALGWNSQLRAKLILTVNFYRTPHTQVLFAQKANVYCRYRCHNGVVLAFTSPITTCLLLKSSAMSYLLRGKAKRTTRPNLLEPSRLSTRYKPSHSSILSDKKHIRKG